MRTSLYSPPECGINSANAFASLTYTVVDVDEGPVGSGVGSSSWRRCFVGVGIRDLAFFASALAVLVYFGRGVSLRELLLRSLRRAAVDVTVVLLDGPL